MRQVGRTRLHPTNLSFAPAYTATECGAKIWGIQITGHGPVAMMEDSRILRSKGSHGAQTTQNVPPLIAMIEQLEAIHALYTAAAGNPDPDAQRDLALAKDQMFAAFPLVYRTLRELSAENQRLRGLQAQGLVSAAYNASPLEFVGFADPDGDAMADTLNEMASEKGLVVGDELVVMESYTRQVHYMVCGGPTLSSPLEPFTFGTSPAGAGPASAAVDDR